MDLVYGLALEQISRRDKMKRHNEQKFGHVNGELSALEAKIGYSFKNKELLRNSLIHKSASDGKTGFINNERLEWLGDRVLGLLCARRLFDGHQSFDEGSLTRHFNNVVNGDNCASAAFELNLDTLVQTSKSITPGSPANESVISDAFEALMGAVYLDGGLEACALLIDYAFSSAAKSSAKKNVKSELQEYLQKQGLDAPKYEILERQGPDHAPKFLVEVRANNYSAKAWGSSKQLAEQAAAQLLIETNFKGK